MLHHRRSQRFSQRLQVRFGCWILQIDHVRAGTFTCRFCWVSSTESHNSVPHILVSSYPSPLGLHLSSETVKEKLPFCPAEITAAFMQLHEQCLTSANRKSTFSAYHHPPATIFIPPEIQNLLFFHTAWNPTVDSTTWTSQLLSVPENRDLFSSALLGILFLWTLSQDSTISNSKIKDVKQNKTLIIKENFKKTFSCFAIHPATL